LADRRTRNHKYVYEYLLQHPCVDCGEKNPVRLTFDHVRGRKKYSVSLCVAHGHSIKSIQKEIDKCEVRCANCHLEKTARERNWTVWLIHTGSI
jgi:hypothetical protein